MWFSLIKQYWQVSLFKRPPEETPYAPLLLCVVGFLYLLLIIGQWIISDIEQQVRFGTALLIAGALIISYVLYTAALLTIFHVSNRLVQTLTSLFSAHAIVHLFVFPLLLLTPLLIETNTTPVLAPFVGVLYLILTLFLTGWQLLISAYIYKHALSIDYFQSALASLGLLACNILCVAII